MTQTEFLTDLFNRRSSRSQNNQTVRLLELNGATVIEPTAFEPDAATYRNEYYYNAVSNTLYRKVVVRNEPGIVVAYWQKVSQ